MRQPLKGISVFIFLSVLSLPAVSQQTAQEKPCSRPEAKQLDFWVGDWSLSWTDKDGQVKSGTNRISKILGGCVIHEEFSDAKNEFAGTSISMFDAKTGTWKQTWVDNEGAYLDFTGEFKDGTMSFHRTAWRDGKQTLQRMRWYNVAQDSLDWAWERSDDNGNTWIVAWKIHYKRKS